MLLIGLGSLIVDLASRAASDDAMPAMVLLVAAVAGFSFASRKERA